MTSFPPLDEVTLCVFAVACLFLGLFGLVLCAGTRRKSLARTERGLLALLVAAGPAGWLLGAPALLWLPALGLAAAAVTLLALRWVSFVGVAGLVQAVVRRPAALWVGIALLGVGTLVAQRVQIEAQLEPDFRIDAIGGQSADQFLQEVETQWAVTDAGEMVPLFTVPLDTISSLIDDDTEMMTTNLGLALIRTEPVDVRYNCHGYVFTEGRFWVRGAAVEGILQDNGYQATKTPRPGDVAVYRDEETNEVAHTGLVRTVLPSGAVLIESKMGSCGRYVHGADKHPYPYTTLTYYHTPRLNHLLTGLDGPRRQGSDITAAE